MGIFFKVLATKHALFRFYGSYLREVIKTTKLMVVAVTHGDDSQLFLVARKRQGKKLMVVAMTHGDDPKKNFVARRKVTRKS